MSQKVKKNTKIKVVSRERDSKKDKKTSNIIKLSLF